MKKLLPVSLVIILLSSCYYDKADKLYATPDTTGTNTGNTCDTTNVSYSGMVKAITNQYCSISGCHDPAYQAGGYDFTTVSDLQQAVANGRLKGAVLHLPGYVEMPNNGAILTQCQINQIVAWANQGAQNN